MKAATIIAIIGAIAIGYTLVDRYNTNSVMMDRYQMFLAEFGKTYNSESEYDYRYQVFTENVNMIDSHNAGNHSHSLGINEFADWTSEEFGVMLGRGGNGDNSDPIPYECDGDYYSEQDHPTTYDWTNEGAVHSVDHQGACGS